LAKKGTKPRSGNKLGSFIGVTIHNTAEPKDGRGAQWLSTMLRTEWKTVSKSWHYGVDEKLATRSIPENEVSWHAGDGRNGKGNTRTISIEICENADGDLLIAHDNAAALAAKILKAHGIKKAVTNKTIFQHNHWTPTDKDCPRKLRAGDPYSWKEFVKRVNAHLVADDI
jgi:N-acetylmuramoyl-L-alanine amidase